MWGAPRTAQTRAGNFSGIEVEPRAFPSSRTGGPFLYIQGVHNMRGILRKYGSLLPVGENTPLLDRGEGGTPLIFCGNLSKEMDIALYAKYEGLNPTGSFKDRGMVLAVSKALEEGARGIICASTGNTSASAAAYAASAGIPCYVLLPAGKVALGKLAQALMYGARVVGIRGNFDDALDLARKASEDLGIAIVNSVNPYRLLGQRTGAWEICEDLGSAPDWHAIPVGNAGNITAYWKGYAQYQKLGRIDSIPRMMGFQAAGASPLVTGLPCDAPETVATAIRIGRPVNAEKAREAVRESRGVFQSVTDEQILHAQGLLASREGLFAEPASATPLAGLLAMKHRGELPSGITVTMVLTGNGLKDPDTAIQNVPSPREVDNSWDALKEVLLA